MKSISIVSVFAALLLIVSCDSDEATQGTEKTEAEKRKAYSVVDSVAAVMDSIAAVAQAKEQQKGSFTDSRDSKTYKTAKIGTQTWMAENLNYNAKGSKCYDNKPANCQKYGRLYNWATAKTACPAGWHWSSSAEWTKLIDFAGGEKTAGAKLKFTSGWDYGDNGTDNFGFAALPGGTSDLDGSFTKSATIGASGSWWSTHSTAYSINGSESGVNRRYVDDGYKYLLASVRCVKD